MKAILHSIPFRVYLTCLALFSSLPAALGQAAGTVVSVEGDRVNLRAVPSLTAEVVGQVEFGAELVVKDGSHTNWLEIVPPANISFWINSAYVEDALITAKKLNVRAGASLNYSVVGELYRREKVTVRGTFGDWLEIAPPASSSLWVSRDFLFIPAPPAPEPSAPALPEPPAPVPAGVQAPVQIAAAPTPRPPPLPVIPPVAPSDDMELVPLPGQGKVVRREGTLHAYLLKGGSPSKYYLSDTLGGRSQLICYVENTKGQLRSYRGKRVIIQGHEYWVQGVERPVIVPRAIIEK